VDEYQRKRKQNVPFFVFIIVTVFHNRQQAYMYVYQNYTAKVLFGMIFVRRQIRSGEGSGGDSQTL